MCSMETSTKRRRRSNAEILADSVAARNAPKKPRKRRTNAEIARDAEKARRAAEAVLETYPRIYFYDDVPALGKVWKAGEIVDITPGSYWAKLAYDSRNEIIFKKTPEQQIKLWGKVRYEVKQELLE